MQKTIKNAYIGGKCAKMCEIWTENAYIGGKSAKKGEKKTKNAYIGGKMDKKGQKRCKKMMKNAYIGEICATLHTFRDFPQPRQL